MQCPCCSPLSIVFCIVVAFLAMAQYFVIPAFLSGLLSMMGNASAGVLFTPLVLMFQSSQFSVYEILFFICCAQSLLSFVSMVRNKKFIDIHICLVCLVLSSALGALCLFIVDLRLWYQLFGLFLMLYAVFISANGQSRVMRNHFFRQIEGFLAGFFGITGAFLTKQKMPVLDYFIIDTTRLVVYLYALNGLERLRESASWGYPAIVTVVMVIVCIIAGMMIVGKTIGAELGEMIHNKIPAQVCKILGATCVLLLGIILLRFGL